MQVFEPLSSGELVAREVNKLVRPLAIGDLGQPFKLHDEVGQTIDLENDHISGCFKVLCFFSHENINRAEGEFLGFKNQARRFLERRAWVFFISAESNAGLNFDLRRRLNLPFPILSDPGGTAFAKYGLKKGEDIPGPLIFRTVLLNPGNRVQAVFGKIGKEPHGDRVLEKIEQGAKTGSIPLMPPHAPVLVIPEVFTPEECRDLIKLYNSKGEFTISRSEFQKEDKDIKIPVFDQDRQDRIDHVIRNPQVSGFLQDRMKQRVFPWIEKAFSFRPQKNEPFHIARYFGKRKGTRIGHRDNTSRETGHRRFALTVNLNKDFEGGEICFREFSQKGYRGDPGTAFIFSSSLLHEIEETTKGTRYNLISHFF